jgi:hypothetical protein
LVRPDVDGDQTIGKTSKPAMEVWPRAVIRPTFVAARQGARLAGRRLAHLLPSRPPDLGGTRPLAMEVRLDAVAGVLLDGLMPLWMSSG